MRVINGKKPNPTFWDTGFYTSENWRYTGKYGIVKHDIPAKNLPKYGQEIKDSIGGSLFLMPYYMLGQIGVSLRDFVANLGQLYHKKDSFKNDLLKLPHALVDFIPALCAGFVSALAPIWTPFALYHLLGQTEPGCIPIGLILASFFFPIAIPLFIAAGVLVGIHGMITSGLMLTKAVLETSLSLLTLLSSPFKWIATAVSDDPSTTVNPGTIVGSSVSQTTQNGKIDHTQINHDNGTAFGMSVGT